MYIPTASGGNSAGGSSGNLRVYQYGLSGTGSPTLSLQGTSSEAFGFGSSAPIITSDGISPGSALVWIVWAPNGEGTGAQLRAYDPIPVSGEPVLRWSAPVGTSSKFAIPGVGAGRLYVGTRDGHVLAFGSPVTPVLSGPAITFPTTTDGSSSERTLTLTATTAVELSSLVSSSPSQFKLGVPSPSLPATLTTGQTIQIPITFAPTGTGPQAATVTAETSTGTKVSFALSGTGQTAAAKLEATPPLVTFEGTTVGEQRSESVTFRNVGGTSLTVNEVQLPKAPFHTEGAPAKGSTIASGASITVTVTFEPTEVGAFTDEIGLETTGGNRTVGLSGAAGLPGVLQISSETTDYGQVLVGTGATKTFTVANTGGTTILITKSKPPNGGAFTATTSLPEGTTIKSGESLTEEVRFAPTAPGVASGVWEINGEGSTKVHEVRFTGVGTFAPPPVQQSPSNQGASPAGQGALLQGPIAPLSPDAELTSAALAASPAGTVNVNVSCPVTEIRCEGAITLRTLTAVRVATGHRRDLKAAFLTLATGSFTVAGGRVATVRLRLSVKARALLARNHVLRARATVVAHDPAGVTHVAHTIVTIRAVRVTHGRRG